MIAILHNIRSIHNTASMFRTADGAGVKKIYLTGITPSPLDKFERSIGQFTKVSLGAEDFVEWEKVKDINRVIKNLRAEGYKIIALEQSPKSVPYYKLPSFAKALEGKHAEVEKSKRICLIVGNEVRGLLKSVLEKCDKILEIPMRGKKESLNVSVAFGIVAYELNRNKL